MQSGFIDLTLANAVESLYRGNVRDPWWKECLASLADQFVFMQQIRCPVPTKPGEPAVISTPSILHGLAHLSPGSLVAEPFDLTDFVAPEYLDSLFDDFMKWSVNRRETLAQWIQLHNQDWLRGEHAGRVPNRLAFDLEALRDSSSFIRSSKELAFAEGDLLYAFDVVLRYPLYGRAAGKSSPYAAHPIRREPPLPVTEDTGEVLPQIPFSIGGQIVALAPSLSRHELVDLLCSARQVASEMRLQNLKPGSVDESVRREFGRRVALPARIKGLQVGIFVVGASCTLGALFGPLASFMCVAGVLVSIADKFWNGSLTNRIGRHHWLRWAVEYDFPDVRKTIRGEATS